MISDNQERVDYIVTHFWRPFFAEDREYSRDTSLVGGVTFDDFHVAMADYATMLMTATPKAGLQAQEYLMKQAEKMELEHPESNVWENVLKACDGLFYDPNSPARNEEMYIPVEEAKMNSPLTTDEEKADAAALLPRLMLNRLGTPANDFGITLQNGRKMRLSDVKADRIILLFSNPGCDECKAAIDLLQSLIGLDTAIEKGRLAIVNVYPDADIEAWKAYAPNYPKIWINGYNEDLDVAGGLYNLRAIPSLYMLDRDRNVIMKDVDKNVLVNLITAPAQ
jgi:hypothetical protein